MLKKCGIFYKRPRALCLLPAKLGIKYAIQFSPIHQFESMWKHEDDMKYTTGGDMTKYHSQINCILAWHAQVMFTTDAMWQHAQESLLQQLHGKHYQIKIHFKQFYLLHFQRRKDSKVGTVS